MTTPRGEVTGRVRGTLNDTGKVLFLKRWRSMMMAHHVLLLLTDAEKRAINTHVTTCDHYNPDTGETDYYGPTILSIIFQKFARIFESTSSTILEPWRMLPWQAMIITSLSGFFNM